MVAARRDVKPLKLFLRNFTLGFVVSVEFVVAVGSIGSVGFVGLGESLCDLKINHPPTYLTRFVVSVCSTPNSHDHSSKSHPAA